jgi:hypothetical protein
MNDTESVRQVIGDALNNSSFRRATFSGRTRGNSPSPWQRVVIRPIELRGERHLQFSYFDSRKNFTRNFRASEIEAPLTELLLIGFAGIHVSTRSDEIDIRSSRKGKVHIGRRKAEADEPNAPQPHNRVKDVPLPEGKADHLLEAMGIVTGSGRVRPTMRAKYTQVNEFLKQLTHVLDQAGLTALGREVQILDCGCGASYLTLAVHHYLNDIRGIPAYILGVDVNEEVIRKSVARSEHLGAERLRFACGRIDTIDSQPDIVLALHACDTATDDAIALAIRREARILLSVPCCHHYLNERIKPAGDAEVLRPLLRHGILQQRTADQVTDALRALVLRIMGYRTEIVEFISPEHTARNLMIRAVRGVPIGERALVDEYREMCRFWGVTPYLEKLLGEPFQALLGARSASKE